MNLNHSFFCNLFDTKQKIKNTYKSSDKINKFDFNFDEMTINKMIYKGKDNPVYKRIPYSLYLCN